jgi:hypothetical protein
MVGCTERPSPGHDLHEREVAKLLFVSWYRPLALLDHVLDRLEDAWVRFTNFLDLCIGSEWSTNKNPKPAAIGQSVRCCSRKARGGEQRTHR